MSDIFISYASEDRDRAKAVAKALKAQGWSVWWDPRIRSGQKFDRAIEAALADSKCVVVLWSKHSADSDWVRAEAARGLDREILISVRIKKGTRLPLQFSHVHTIPLFNWDGIKPTAKFNEFIGDVKAILTGTQPSTTDVSTQPTADPATVSG